MKGYCNKTAAGKSVTLTSKRVAWRKVAKEGCTGKAVHCTSKKVA